jgi:hypothetical protein
MSHGKQSWSKRARACLAIAAVQRALIALTTAGMNRVIPAASQSRYCARMDNEWAMDQLRQFIHLTTSHTEDNGGYAEFEALSVNDATVVEALQVVEQILNRVTPNWRAGRPGLPDGLWRHEHLATVRALAQLQRAAELAEKLGEAAPKMGADAMHSWAWEGARSLWQSRHYGEAVRAAIVKLNAELQNKVQRPDLSETSLFQQALSSDAATPGTPRLRLRGDDGSKTASSVRRGVLQLAEGCFAAIRNPASHTPIADNDEQLALEQLALVSLLSRWIDEAEVVTS